MTYNDFRSIWFSALDYTPDQRDLYINERGWQAWMEEYGEDTAAIICTLDNIYDMAHMGCKAVRSMTGLSRKAFCDAYSLPVRTVEDWESERREPPLHSLMMLGFAVLSDSMEKRKAEE